MSAESDSFSSSSPDPEPTRELLLAQALESCIRAERRVPGSADQIIARQPAWARAELRRLVAVASSLDAVAANAVMSEDFRLAARTRLMRRIAPELADLPQAISQNGHGPVTRAWLMPGAALTSHHPARRRRWRWLRRGGLGGLLAAALIAAATLTASASALPGEPLYSIKQAREELGVRLAADQDARTLALLNQADARLEETTRLLQQGRTDEVAQTTQGFDDALERATTTYVVTVAGESPTDPTAGAIESRLSQQQEHLQMLLANAPAPAQADLREALVATERSRALVADPKPADTRASRPRPVVAAPTVAPDVEPTSEPTPLAPAQLEIAPRPTPVPVVAQVADRHDDDAAQAGQEERGDDRGGPTAVAINTVAPVVSAFGGNPQSGRRQGSRVQAVPLAPAVATVEDAGDDDGGQPQQAVQSDGGHAVSADGGVVAPAPNQDSGHDRVAEQPTSPATAVVAQREGQSESNGGGGDGRGDVNARTSASANQAATTSGQGGQTITAGTASNARASTSHDGGDTQRVATPVPVTTARTQASSNGTDDHHSDVSTSRDATARVQSGGSSSGAQNTSPSRTGSTSGSSSASTSGTRSGSGSQSGSNSQSSSSGGSRDGGGR